MIRRTQPQTRRCQRKPETENCFVGARGVRVALLQYVDDEAGEEDAEDEGDGVRVDVEGFVVKTDGGSEGDEEGVGDRAVGGVD